MRQNPFERHPKTKEEGIASNDKYYRDETKTENDIIEIFSNFGADVARAARVAHGEDDIELRNENWIDAPKSFPIEIILRSSEIDWDAGTLKATLSHDSSLGDKCELLRAATLDSEIHVSLGGMSFESNDIEALLLPKLGAHIRAGKRVGARIRKYPTRSSDSGRRFWKTRSKTLSGRAES